MRLIEAPATEVKIVNPAPVAIMSEFFRMIEVVESYPEDDYGLGSHLREKGFNRLGGGACGSVFMIGEDYVMKVNEDEGMGLTCQDGLILEDLQGLPCVPTLYAYSEGSRFTLIERIKGVTVGEFEDYGQERLKGFDLSGFDKDEWVSTMETFYNMSCERGWRPNDLHCYNCMVDRNGKLWVVDYGLFKQSTKQVFRNCLSELIDHVHTVTLRKIVLEQGCSRLQAKRILRGEIESAAQEQKAPVQVMKPFSARSSYYNQPTPRAVRINTSIAQGFASQVTFLSPLKTPQSFNFDKSIAELLGIKILRHSPCNLQKPDFAEDLMKARLHKIIKPKGYSSFPF